MPNVKIHPIILSGGSGTRLWPLSRELFPKQFHRLTDPTRSLLQETVLRFAGHGAFAKPLVVANEAHRFALGAQLQDIGASASSIILEPCARGTAPAIAAAMLSSAVSKDDLLLAAPTDHYFGEPDVFRSAILDAVPAALDGRIVVFGLTPQRPETGYGYVHAGEPWGSASQARNIRGFVEKPPAAGAERLMRSGEHFWNLGVFLFRKSALLEEFAIHAPQVLHAAEAALRRAKFETDFCRLDAEEFSRSPQISIDYAIMEKTARGAVLPVTFPWSDLGAWNSLWEAKRPLDGDSESLVSVGDVKTWDVSRSYIRSDGGLVVAIGVKDLIVVSSNDATLVAAMDRAGDVGKVVDQLKQEKRREARNHLLVHRPWGHFLTLAEGPGYQVKVLTLDPYASISMQFHRQRAERWVVVEGAAEVYLDGRTHRLKEHESIEIPRGAKHRLSNTESRALKVIEVQSGDYLGEDDIVRLD
jgi:mannose-1-phosphate guanylyltransferase/mannose-6-phosphate isomerase